MEKIPMGPEARRQIVDAYFCNVYIFCNAITIIITYRKSDNNNTFNQKPLFIYLNNFLVYTW